MFPAEVSYDFLFTPNNTLFHPVGVLKATAFHTAGCVFGSDEFG
jgi:hypothetical protein